MILELCAPEMTAEKHGGHKLSSLADGTKIAITISRSLILFIFLKIMPYQFIAVIIVIITSIIIILVVVVIVIDLFIFIFVCRILTTEKGMEIDRVKEKIGEE